MTRIPCLSVRQPWAWCILRAGKDVENRGWFTEYRGPLLIHASSSRPTSVALEALSQFRGITVPDDLPRSAIVGLVDLTDIVGDSTSRWAVDGEYHWLLAHPRPLPSPIAGHGKLRLWYPPQEVVRCALQQLGLPLDVVRHSDGSATAYY